MRAFRLVVHRHPLLRPGGKELATCPCQLENAIAVEPWMNCHGATRILAGAILFCFHVPIANVISPFDPPEREGRGERNGGEIHGRR